MKKVSLLFLALPLAVSAQAQDKQRLSLEEVIVTASKRETNLQDTAIAVSAFTSDMLESLDINSPFDFESLVPSFTYQQTRNRISIRGVGRFSNSLGVSPGVAIYNDGIFTAEAAALSSQPMNIQQTEILRGPQGTLYGRNTTGGAVNVISKRPTDEFHGDFRAKFGNYGTQEFGFVITGPITDSFRYKLHAYDAERDGLQDNEAGTDLRTVDSTYLEAQLEWDITDDLSVWLKYGTLETDPIAGAAPSDDPYDCLNFWDGLGRSVQFMECQEGKENVSIGDPRGCPISWLN